MKQFSFRDKSGKFAKFPLGAVVFILDKNTHSMQEVYYVVIGAKNGKIATIPYTYAPTHLHKHNFEVKDYSKLEIKKILSSSEINQLIIKIKMAILERPKDDPYNDVALHAISQLEFINS